MARSKQTSNKREKEKGKLKKKKEKEQRKQERQKLSTKGMGLEALMTAPEFKAAPQQTSEAVVNKPVQRAVATTSETKEAPRTGRISYLNPQKGYGFIKDSSIRENLFFDISELKEPFKLNDEVIFTKVKGPKGSTATGIKKTSI